MATAYAALVSLMQIIEQTKQHPRPPISLDQAQVNSLSEKVHFLQDFLECYRNGSNELDGLESRIADAAHAAADIIESGIVDRILAGSTSRRLSVDLFEGLRKVIGDMDSIIMEGVLKIKEKARWEPAAQPRTVLRPPRSEQNVTVGLDEKVDEIMDKLISSNESNCVILPIVGMAGIGKTTLARNIYSDPLILHHFDIRAWTTVSQDYSIVDILRELHSEFNIISKGDSSEKSLDDLGEVLYKFLWGRRYVIIMDDMWTMDAWEKIRFFFPRTNIGSRIIVTTRMSEVALRLSSYQLEMSFLDDDKSWELFCKILFGGRGCPLELREAGKKITMGCKGLPLSIVVIGGLLTKSEYTREYWEHIAENFNSVLNLEDNQRCFNILYMSYNQLPLHLKPCFLYMGVFPEDEVIRASMLAKLWVAEGLIRAVRGKSVEDVALEYMRDLIGRNLVILHKLGSTDNIKYCNIHDLLRDLCLREAQKERFYNFIREPSLDIEHGMQNNNDLRIVLSASMNFGTSAKRTRSLVCISGEAPFLQELRLLRIWRTFDRDSYEEEDLNLPMDISHLVNLRYVGVKAEDRCEFQSSIRQFWHLETLIVDQVWPEAGASEFWNMPFIRHVKFTELELPDPPPSNDAHDENDVVLRNLQTLSKVRNFRCGEEVVKRLQNVKKLSVFYDKMEENLEYCLDNVGRLDKLESLSFLFFPSAPDSLQRLTFPKSLKKLTISQFHWEEMLWKIGDQLPLLEKLKLINGHMKERTWETIAGEFSNLKFLQIEGCNIECWETDSNHFPRLKHLALCNLEKLKEIPLEIGCIATLEWIRLEFCSSSSVVSARRMVEYQLQEYGNTYIHVHVLAKGRKKKSTSSAIPNFHVEYIPT